MLISHRKQFIYTKTAKTASTSVESYFEQYCMPEGEWSFQHARDEYVSETGIIGYRGSAGGESRWFNHMSAADIRDKIGAEAWNAYFKFTVIRDPFDKLVSGYFFSIRGIDHPPEPVAGFRDWVKNGGDVIDRHTYTIEGELCMDYYIRYEALTDGIRHVCNALQLPYEPERLPVLKGGFREQAIPLSAFYDPETRAIVEQKYAFELAHFGYQCPTA